MTAREHGGHREYRPGHDAVLLVHGSLTVLVPATLPDAILGRLWQTLASEDADLYAVLDSLTAEFGVGRLPSFGIAEHGDRLRLLVRGDVRATVTTPTGAERVSAAEVGTWLERAFAAWSAVQLLGAASEDGAERRKLPLLGGVVGADAVVVSTGARAPVAADSDATSVAEALAPVPADSDAAAPDATAPDATLAPEATVTPDATVASEEAEASQVGEGPEAAEAASAVPDEELPTTTSGYDHLWGSTVIRSVEDAAVRSEDADGVSDNDVEDADAVGLGPDPVTPAVTPPTGTLESEPPAGPEPVADPEPARWTPPSLIDSVPWGAPADRPEHAAGPGHSASPGHSAGPERTAISERPAIPERSITSELFGDHDGETVMRSDVDAVDLTLPPESQGRPAAGAGRPTSSEGGRTPGPLVVGRRCPQGHANPPSYAQCAACGDPISGEPEQLPRPALGRVRFSNGEVIELSQPLVVGRQPSVSRVASGGMPRLVSVASPSGDISRNHLEVRLEGWHVMVRDLKATNGTVLERPGQTPRRLAQGEMMIVLDGDIADLGDGVTLRFEAVP